jgi:hypothetical protein
LRLRRSKLNTGKTRNLATRHWLARMSVRRRIICWHRGCVFTDQTNDVSKVIINQAKTETSMWLTFHTPAIQLCHNATTKFELILRFVVVCQLPVIRDWRLMLLYNHKKMWIPRELSECVSPQFKARFKFRGSNGVSSPAKSQRQTSRTKMPSFDGSAAYRAAFLSQLQCGQDHSF